MKLVRKLMQEFRSTGQGKLPWRIHKAIRGDSRAYEAWLNLEQSRKQELESKIKLLTSSGNYGKIADR